MHKKDLQQPIYINSFASISALGSSEEEVWKSYLEPRSFFQKTKINQEEVWVSSFLSKEKEAIQKLQKENTKYKNLDPSVLFAIYASRTLVSQFVTNEAGVNIGSSRGATTLLEKYHKEFIETSQVSTLTSPTTTLGNLSSWIAQDLSLKGPSFSHSITCSTALHSILNAVAWLRSGMAKEFIVGGTEAPLTPFTIAQMKALKLYASYSDDAFPCKSLQFPKKGNSLILGEAAAVFAISTKPTEESFEIIGIGYATEMITHSTSISVEADCFQKSMYMAMKDAGINNIDAIVMHAAGTQKGDEAELKAIQLLFNDLPLITTNKWKIGHCFGASGAMSLEMAVLMLKHNHFISNPFYQQSATHKKLQHIMVNAVGFGGNAVTIVVSANKKPPSLQSK